MVTAAATMMKTTRVELPDRLRLPRAREMTRISTDTPFEPIASILAHCEEKTGSMMRPTRELA